MKKSWFYLTALCAVFGLSMAACDEDEPCTNHKLDHEETDVDCGGMCSTKCELGKRCTTHNDCQSGNCDISQNTCAEKPTTPTTDTECTPSDPDQKCGGTCKTKCNDGAKCSKKEDCSSANCGSGNKCEKKAEQPEQCQPSDTENKCGGDCKTKCSDGQKCSAATDCTSNKCLKEKCVPADTCDAPSDAAQNCGKNCTKQCENGSTCTENDDCKSKKCDSSTHKCVVNDEPCTKPSDAAKMCGGDCKKCGAEGACQSSKDCESNDCNHGYCACASTDSSGCGGDCNTRCPKGKGCKVSEDCESPLKCGGEEGKKKCIEVPNVSINEVMGSPTAGDSSAEPFAPSTLSEAIKNKAPAVLKSTNQCEFVEILNLGTKEIKNGSLVLKLVKTSELNAATQNSLKMFVLDEIPANGVLVVSGQAIDFPAEDGIKNQNLDKSNLITNTEQYHLWLEYNPNDPTNEGLMGVKFSEVIREKTTGTVSTKGRSQNRVADKNTETAGLVFHDTIESQDALYSSPGYCVNGKLFKDNCE